MRPAIFLDRDGVLNRAIVRDRRPYPPSNLAELELSDGALEACVRFQDAGLPLIVVSNQPDITRGTTTQEEVQAVNSWLMDRLPLTEIRICPHDDSDNCPCRKPKPGLLMSAASELGVDLRASIMVGDRWRDVEAGKRAGCRTVWIDCNYDERSPEAPDFRTTSLLGAADWILESIRKGVPSCTTA
ncbi:MAG TPA: HAD family hydrolase [Bryobacteraceae bacterium]|nr:HAD family hydrolase [Bryobacteraceae bacterium]